jgi:hypothetical protein
MVLELVPKEAVSPSDEKKAVRQDKPTYSGMERRRAQRRITVDRRDMIRFDSTDRRSGAERRTSLGLWKDREY